MINEDREAAGSPPVALGHNGAAQIHADQLLENCISGHWGVDGTTPGMRYALAGGQQVNGENVTGLNYCIQLQDNFKRIVNPVQPLRTALTGLMGSPGHLATILNPQYRKVNLGIAWNDYNMVLVQQFEGDYVRFEQLPVLEGTNLTFAGETTNGARMNLGRNGLKVDIYYHPLSPLTQGQIAKTYCLDIGLILGSLIPLAPPGSSYKNLAPSSMFYERCKSPYDAPSTSVAPSSSFDAHEMHRQNKKLATFPHIGTVRFVVADRWNVEGTSFSVSADIGDILDVKGPGVYQLIFWGTVDGKPQVVADYLVFYQVEPPTTYR